MKINNKFIIVTGGANGIGREVVLELLRGGAHVAALDINKQGLEETKIKAEKFAANLSLYVCNIADLEDVEKTTNLIIDEFKTVDGLINVAGVIQPFKNVEVLSYKDVNRVMTINFYGTVYMVKTLLPHLLERPEASIVNVSSMGGFIPVPGQSIYGASKAAVKLFTEGLYTELIDTNVSVTLVYPGAVETDITKNSGVKMNISAKDTKIKMLKPNECAKIIIRGMEKKKFRVLAGRDAKIMDLLSRLMPKRSTMLIAKKMKELKM